MLRTLVCCILLFPLQKAKDHERSMFLAKIRLCVSQRKEIHRGKGAHPRALLGHSRKSTIYLNKLYFFILHTAILDI